MTNRAFLALADGTIFEGRSFGYAGEATGEIVFNTSLTGYQEILTDPSYKGQIVTMTYPHIGNYGVNDEDMESPRLCAEGLVVREFSRRYSNWRARMGLDEFLARQRVVGIEGIDTRALTKHIRDQGEQVAIISSTDLDPDRLARRAAQAPGLIGRDLVREVTCPEAYPWGGGGPSEAVKRPRVVAYDFGVKHNILRMLGAAGCEVSVVPASVSAEELMGRHPDGVLLSNGPGDPAALDYAVANARKLIGNVPLFGICLGHQILGLALGASTYKLKFGHHGGNHPVMDLATREVKITTQNHGFAVAFEGISSEALKRSAGGPGPLPRAETPFGPVEVTHVSLNDHTLEGMRCPEARAVSVQYHPESSPGPHDARYLFGGFIDMMKGS